MSSKDKALYLAIGVAIVVMVIFFALKDDEAGDYAVDESTQIVDVVDVNASVGMVAVYDDGSFVYYCDSYTGVMYLWRKEMNAGGLTAMIDVDGTAFTYEEWLAYSK